MSQTPNKRIELFRISIGGKDIPVYLNDAIEPYGHFLRDDYEIELHPDCLVSRELFLRIVRHECLHACFTLSGLAWGLEGEAEETIVRMMDGMGWAAAEQTTKKAKEAWKVVAAAKKSNKTKSK
jgi:hypothetical protein